MSRSFKRTPIMKMCPVHGRIGKQFANRRVRRHKKEIPSGCAYKRLYEQYDIHDWISYCPLNDYLCPRYWYLLYGRDETIQTTIKKWKKDYYWK